MKICESTAVLSRGPSVADADQVATRAERSAGPMSRTRPPRPSSAAVVDRGCWLRTLAALVTLLHAAGCQTLLNNTGPAERQLDRAPFTKPAADDDGADDDPAADDDDDDDDGPARWPNIEE